ncbi:PREDICTED: leukocyte surface antigen CD53-like isoform X1 [Wasmannia auropunctata]|uniref:leukocyte surface antigen CD53-like isoform X1 n=1 Tax=Wasmannia auropunctata TaxID=64793 RepID=UPI0005F0C5C5|nr:PREDICTED: leukocyte surface antigen CD53-like isoform X1 [Wasmannia auropunctata]
MGRAFACFRYCLVAGAILLGISGAIMSVCAGYFIYQLHEYAPLTPSHVCGSSATLLAMGVIICGIGWFAWQFLDFSNKGQVIVLAIALAIIVLIETSVGIWTLVRHEQIDTLSAARHQEIFALAITDDKPIWDHMQSALRCCGIDGSSDYRGKGEIPWSCCNTTNQETDNDSTAGACTVMYKRGCQHVVLSRTRSILLHVFLLALCSVLLQVRLDSSSRSRGISRIGQLIDWRSRLVISDFLHSVHDLLRQDLQRQDGKAGVADGRAHVSARYARSGYQEQAADTSVEIFAQF